jgi:hypothetical protein
MRDDCARDTGSELDEVVLAGLVDRVSDAKRYTEFLVNGERCHWCAQPVRLVGASRTVDGDTGEVMAYFGSASLPGGEYLKACGTRRATRCPACAQLYQGDARALITSGMAGGKGVPAAVRTHPMVFATLTGPSFGAVHRQPPSGGPCSARGRGRCSHGRQVSCVVHHNDNDPRLGEAICAECYDYDGAVLFNASISELWRRTVIYARRHLARLLGRSAAEVERELRFSYAKVVEFQARGVVHVHAIVRLDRVEGFESPLSEGASLVALALQVAANQVSVPYPGGRGEARWGSSSMQSQCQITQATTSRRLRTTSLSMRPKAPMREVCLIRGCAPKWTSTPDRSGHIFGEWQRPLGGSVGSRSCQSWASGAGVTLLDLGRTS